MAGDLELDERGGVKTQRTRRTQSSEGVLFSLRPPRSLRFTLPGGFSCEVAVNCGESLTIFWGALLCRDFSRAAYCCDAHPPPCPLQPELDRLAADLLR